MALFVCFFMFEVEAVVENSMFKNTYCAEDAVLQSFQAPEVDTNTASIYLFGTLSASQNCGRCHETCSTAYLRALKFDRA